MKTKDQAFEKFKEWKTLVENQSGFKVKKLRTDNGLEFCNKAFDEFCSDQGIARHKTIPYTPQQNGVVERMNRTILERVRSMLNESGLPKVFWAEAVNTAVYLILMRRLHKFYSGFWSNLWLLEKTSTEVFSRKIKYSQLQK